MSEKRLMLFAPSAYPLGGVATWAGYLLPGLRTRGWRPTLALTEGRCHDPEAYLGIHPFEPVVTVPCGAGTQAARVRHAARVIARARPDIVAVVNLPDVALAAQRLRRRGAFSGKLAMIEHGIDRETLIDMRRLLGAIDAFVGTNRLVCALARRFAGFARERIFHAPYGVACGQTPALSRDRTSPKLNLLYAGRLEAEQKRVHDLPLLADELAKRGVAFRLAIAGGGPEEAMLRRRFAGSPHDVAFLGIVAPQQLCETTLARADALVIPSAWETGPLVAFEAMAAGAPVVMSRFVGSKAEGAFVDGENCLMFPVGDMGAAADAVARLDDPALRRRLADSGRSLVAARYSREASVARWDEALTKILALPALAPAPESVRLAPSGRLERWFGPGLGERVSTALGRAYRHREPGGEWPHLLARSEHESETFDRLMAACETGVCA